VKNRQAITTVTAAALLALVPYAPSGAQSAGSPSITWYTIDSGGQRSTSASGLVLHGTIGQWDAATSNDGSLSLGGGFWPGRRADTLFSDRFEQ